MAIGEEPAARLDSLDYGQTLSAVARLAVPEYADWCCCAPTAARRRSARRDAARDGPGAPSLQDRTAELRVGDTLVLYTEVRLDQVSYEGIERLTAAATVDGLMGATIGSLQAVRDDVAVLAVRASPNGAPSTP